MKRASQFALGLLLAVAMQGAAAQRATVITDQADYAPGTIVTITGTGWKPGEAVTLSFVESPLVDTHPDLYATADPNGNIFNNQFSPDQHDVNITFTLTATGQTSGLQAQTTFTDATSLKTVAVGAQSPPSITPGGTATFTVTVNFNGNGSCTVGLSVTSTLPTGATPAFSPTNVTGTGTGNQTSTLTITTTNATPANTYSLTVQATGTGGTGNNCTSTSTASGTGSLVVVAGPAATLTLAGFPSPATAGTSNSFTVTAKDANGNVAQGYTGTVKFTSSDVQAVLPANYTFVAADNGVHTFTATLRTVGVQSITGTDTVTGTITGTQSGIQVSAPIARKGQTIVAQVLQKEHPYVGISGGGI